MNQEPTRRSFIVGAAASAGIGGEAIAQGKVEGERITLSRLEFNALHFGITSNQLKRLQAAGAEFDGNDITMNIVLYGRKLPLGSSDKVIRILPKAGGFEFTIANDKGVRVLMIEK